MDNVRFLKNYKTTLCFSVLFTGPGDPVLSCSWYGDNKITIKETHLIRVWLVFWEGINKSYRNSLKVPDWWLSTTLGLNFVELV
ncbi:hypothetical protein I79_005752 [Cricetulus griseus]|uniref:Uncharacterized protein n=1 Tax=Cricetulus griseus TaxID=10029 RepID=G3H603_CRIGR|nr:hypothetical protein I79_005752 [Cricetulus griseus]